MKNLFTTKKIAYLLASMAFMFLFTRCQKDDNDGFPSGTDSWSHIACIARIPESSAGWSVCIMDKNGNNLHKIVDRSFGFSIPMRSHSGKQLLFSSNGLYFVGTDGTGLTLIEGADGNAAWSPDDKQIVYVKSGNIPMSSDLLIYNIADKTHTLLQANGSNKACVNFSPDGKQIAYSACNEDGIAIYTIDVNGRNNRLLIQYGHWPVWSPKGDKIAYLSIGIDGSDQISVANADGSDQRQLTSSVSPEWWDTGFPRDGNSDPQWAPDGRKIVYVSHKNIKPEIFIMNADGSNQKRLTKAEYRDEHPEVTPDGNYILFASRRSDMMEGGICVMNLDGSNQKVISNTGIYPTACK